MDMTGGTAMAGSSGGPAAGTAGYRRLRLLRCAAGTQEPTAEAECGVGRYTVYEITLPFSEAGLANVWEDVTVSAVFTSPSGKAITVKGFYHSQDTWKIRFAPSELGTYTYHATIAHAPEQKVVDGSFDCVASQEKGFVRASAQNPLRLVFEDGSLYNALGIGSCDDNPHNARLGSRRWRSQQR